MIKTPGNDLSLRFLKDTWKSSGVCVSNTPLRKEQKTNGDNSLSWS